jgi:hypothetical protein
MREMATISRGKAKNPINTDVDRALYSSQHGCAMNTNETVVGTHHGVNLYPIPGYSHYLISKCGQVFSIRKNRWLSQRTCQKGYLRVALQTDESIQRTIKTHRVMGLAFLFVGTLDVDHINRIKTDNRLSNLRAVSRAKNVQNQIAKGTQETRYGWTARIKHYGKRIYLGTFSSQDDAHAIYMAKKLELGHIP